VGKPAALQDRDQKQFERIIRMMRNKDAKNSCVGLRISLSWHDVSFYPVEEIDHVPDSFSRCVEVARLNGREEGGTRHQDVRNEAGGNLAC
jgi:hypothetical protein